MRLPFWREWESGISIERLPPIFSESEEGLVIAGLHSLARRFERGERTEESMLRDLFPLVKAYPKAAAALAADFPVEVSGGHWRCTVMTGNDGAGVIAVRTFVAA
jgi:hypothetical protein